MSSFRQTELLISEIEKRPLIWNRTNEDYKNKKLKNTAWDEVCKALNPQYDKVGSKQKSQILYIIQSRWKSVRDNLRRTQRKPMRKCGSKYVFADNLAFLDKSMTELDSDNGHNFDEPQNQDESIAPEDEQEELDDEEPNMLLANVKSEVITPSTIPSTPTSSSLQVLKRKNSFGENPTALNFEESDADKDFFNSLLPSVRNLTEDQKLLFKAEVIMVLRRIRFGGLETQSAAPFNDQPMASSVQLPFPVMVKPAVNHPPSFSLSLDDHNLAVSGGPN